MKGLRNALLPSLVVWAVLIYGCASLGTFTPKGAAIANNAVTVATGLLKALDGFYGNLLALKEVPDYTTQATRALSLADVAAAGLRAVIAGATADDAKLNLLAGQVDGAKAMLAEMK